jgi:hypothetical protein
VEQLTWIEFKKLDSDQKFLLIGHTLMVVGGTFLAFGNLFALTKGQLPVTPIGEFSSKDNSSYNRKRSDPFFIS